MRFVGQPILAAAGFQPAHLGKAGSAEISLSRPKGGCSHDWLPHILKHVEQIIAFCGLLGFF
jgi:hypothetical protein